MTNEAIEKEMKRAREVAGECDWGTPPMCDVYNKLVCPVCSRVVPIATALAQRAEEARWEIGHFDPVMVRQAVNNPIGVDVEVEAGSVRKPSRPNATPPSGSWPGHERRPLAHLVAALKLEYKQLLVERNTIECRLEQVESARRFARDYLEDLCNSIAELAGCTMCDGHALTEKIAEIIAERDALRATVALQEPPR
jgi:hypothetical protein